MTSFHPTDAPSETTSPRPLLTRSRAGCAFLLLVLGCVLGCVPACGGTSDASGANSETTLEDWSDYCVATFSEDYDVVDAFGDVTFTARTGDEYLVASLDVDDEPELIYLASTGPWVFEVTPDGGLPFISNCEAGSTTDHMAVFSTTTVYSDETLGTPICELTAGSVLPRTPTGSGHSLAGDGPGNDLIYNVILNAFATECGGATDGYIRVPPETVFGVGTWLIPIQSIVGPA